MEEKKHKKIKKIDRMNFYVNDFPLNWNKIFNEKKAINEIADKIDEIIEFVNKINKNNK